MTIYPTDNEINVDATNMNYWEALMVPKLRPHLVGIGPLGQLSPEGPFKTTPEDVDKIFRHYLPEITKEWQEPIKILFYAHGGLAPLKQSVTSLWTIRETLIANKIYPIFFLWQTDFLPIVFDQLHRLAKEKKGALKPNEQVAEITDKLIEDTFRAGGFNVRSMWNEIKQKAIDTSTTGGAKHVIDSFAKNMQRKFNVHLVGHSAGGNFHAYFAQALCKSGLKIKSCTLWAPACSIAVANTTFIPLLNAGQLEHLTVYALTDQAEVEDDCMIYKKSIMHLISNALEGAGHRELFGMRKHILDNAELKEVFKTKADLIISPNEADDSQPKFKSSSTTHGGFDDDIATVQSTIARILSA